MTHIDPADIADILEIFAHAILHGCLAEGFVFHLVRLALAIVGHLEVVGAKVHIHAVFRVHGHCGDLSQAGEKGEGGVRTIVLGAVHHLLVGVVGVVV